MRMTFDFFDTFEYIKSNLIPVIELHNRIKLLNHKNVYISYCRQSLSRKIRRQS